METWAAREGGLFLFNFREPFLFRQENARRFT
jgi:hypothetical protein